MATDPNWLLSTTAQSAAALVAIVGGLLVSRVISLAADRDGVARRLKELAERERSTSVQLEGVFADRHRVSVESFQHRAVDAYVAARGDLSAHEAVERFLQPGATPEELHDAARDFGAQVRGLVAAAQDLHTAGRRLTIANLRSAGHVVSEADDFIISAIGRGLGLYGETERPNEDRSQAVSMEREQERQDRRIEQEDSLRSALLTIDIERTLLHSELGRLSSPREVWAGLAVLTYFAVVGVVVPLGYMASRPVKDSLVFRRMIVGLFLSGLVALVAYVVVAIRRLGRD